MSSTSLGPLPKKDRQWTPAMSKPQQILLGFGYHLYILNNVTCIQPRNNISKTKEIEKKSDCLLSFFSFPNATCFDQVSIILPAVDQHFNSKTGSHFLVKSGTSLIYVWLWQILQYDVLRSLGRTFKARNKAGYTATEVAGGWARAIINQSKRPTAVCSVSPRKKTHLNR